METKRENGEPKTTRKKDRDRKKKKKRHLKTKKGKRKKKKRRKIKENSEVMEKFMFVEELGDKWLNEWGRVAKNLSKFPEFGERNGKLKDIDIGHIENDEISKKLFELLEKFQDVFGETTVDVGCIEGTEFEIKLRENYKDVIHKPYRLTDKEGEELERQIQQLLAHGIIQKSYSKFASPAFLVGKQKINGKEEYRVVVNYKSLNDETITDPYPMPIIEDLLDQFHNKRIFSSLDMVQSYLQMKINGRQHSSPPAATTR